ncbi:MAG: DUF2203 domain-containing protein [Ignavibacteriales bacterium]|nr:DUF2203 domain-containing protein [Ignavibacteriales bacterium]
MNFTKYFTPDEASKTLPYVKRIVRDIINTSEFIRSLATQGEKDEFKNLEMQTLAKTINNYIKELEEVGCYYKDWNFTIGLVDFPSIIDKKEAMLCWRSDEDEIIYYHESQSGYAGRKLIPEEYFLNKEKVLD